MLASEQMRDLGGGGGGERGGACQMCFDAPGSVVSWL